MPAKAPGTRRAVRAAATKKPTPAKRASKAPTLPVLQLGEIAANGVSASVYGLIDRGVARRPKVAKATRGTVELRFREPFAPLRIVFAADTISVHDIVDEQATPDKADLIISGSLPDIVQLATAPLIGGVPKPTTARGRAAIARIANGRVRIEGKPLLARQLLKLLEI